MTTAYYSTLLLTRNVLPLATNGEILALSRVFDEMAEHALNPDDLAVMVTMKGGHAIGNWLRNEGVPYTELLHDVAKLLKVDDIQPLDILTSTGLSISEMDKRALNETVDPLVVSTWHLPLDQYMQRQEKAILLKFMSDAYERMTPTQRAEVDRKVAELAKQLPASGIVGLSSSAAFLVIANAGGFATYMLLSTVISTLTAGLAGFGVYTSASSILSMLIGPVGWAALGIAAIYKLGGPSKQQCVKSVIAIALLRSRLTAQQE